jgi:hypothetical protein
LEFVSRLILYQNPFVNRRKNKVPPTVLTLLIFDGKTYPWHFYIPIVVVIKFGLQEKPKFGVISPTVCYYQTFHWLLYKLLLMQARIGIQTAAFWPQVGSLQESSTIRLHFCSKWHRYTLFIVFQLAELVHCAESYISHMSEYGN